MLEIKNLTIQTADKSLVNDLFLMIQGRVGLIGESGSGKSITGKSIFKVLPPQLKVSGSVIFKGENLLKLPEEKIKKLRGNRISYVAQEPMSALNRKKTVLAQLEEVFVVHNKPIDHERIFQLLEQFGFQDPKKEVRKYPLQFSGGQLQRIILAMSLLLKPEIIVFDEPTTSLDMIMQKEIIDYVRSLSVEYLFITHNLELLTKITDEIYVIKEGIILEHQKTKKLLEHPQHPYTKELLEAGL